MSKLKSFFKDLFPGGVMPSGKTVVRMLVDHPVEGKPYKINSIVLFPDAVAKELCRTGVADAAQEAVEYCAQELGAKLIEHGAEPKADPAAGA